MAGEGHITEFKSKMKATNIDVDEINAFNSIGLRDYIKRNSKDIDKILIIHHKEIKGDD